MQNQKRKRKGGKESKIYCIGGEDFEGSTPSRDRLYPRSHLLPSPLPLSFPSEVRHYDECPPSEVGQRDRCPPPETRHRDRCPPPVVPFDYTSNYFTDYTKHEYNHDSKEAIRTCYKPAYSASEQRFDCEILDPRFSVEPAPCLLADE